MTLSRLLSRRLKFRIFSFVVGLILFGLLSFLPNPSARAQSCDENPPEGYVQQISGLVDGDELTITVSSRFGGAVESLVWRGKEFINIFDHGRQISYAWQMDGYGECFNPTEPGSASDLFSQTSTSELLEVCRLDSNILTTKTQPAFWLAPGESGFCDGGTVTAVNETLISDQILDKTIEIGYMGIENVIAFTAEITIPQDYDFLQLEIPTGYLTYEFTNYWRFDPLSGELIKPESQSLVEPWSYVNDGNLPPILATEDGAFAMGAYSTEDIAVYEILRYEVPNPADTTNKWNIVLQEQPAPAGTYTYQSFAIVGTLEEVAEAMARLFELRPTDISPPMGYVDLASCEAIDGWAWDPKTPNQPIDIEVREVNPDETESLLARITADRFREDLPLALGDNGEHAFTIQTSEILHDGNEHTIRVYGLNSNPNLPARPLLPPDHVLECPQFSPAPTSEPTEPPPPTEEEPGNNPLPRPTTETSPPQVEENAPVEAEDAPGNLPCMGSGALPLLAGLTILSKRRRKSKRVL
jgi:hypothetical protein